MSNHPELWDLDEFIKKTGAKPVTSDKTFSDKRNKILDPNGVYSEEIFGRLGSSQRRKKFGYIQLPEKVIAPAIFDEVTGGILSSVISKVVFNSAINGAPFYLMNDGSFSTQKENPEKGIYAIKEFKSFNDFYNFLRNEQNSNEFQILKKKIHEKGLDSEFNFILENLDRIFVDKIIVIPAAYRDIFIKENVVKEHPLSQLYQKLIRLAKKYESSKNASSSGDVAAAFGQISETEFSYDKWARAVYSTLHQIAQELVNIIGFGKKGKLIRSAKLAKRLDHTVRLVLVNDNNLKPTEVKIPWIFINKLYEEFLMHYILSKPEYSDVKDWLVQIAGTDKIDKNVFREVMNKIVQNPRIVPENVKEKIIEIQKRIIEGKDDGYEKYVIVIRHPVESSDSILGMKPVIDPEDNYTAALPQTVFSTLGADSDGDQINIYAVFTPSANKEIKEKLSFNNPSSLQSVTKFGARRVSIDMDLALGIYELVKNG